MDLTFDRHEDALIIAIRGKIDIVASGELTDALVEQIRCGWRKLVIDLSQIELVTRAGMRGLVVAAKLLQAVRGEMRICGAEPQIEAFLNRVSFTHLLAFDADEKTSVAALSPTMGRSAAHETDITMSLAELLTAPSRPGRSGPREAGACPAPCDTKQRLRLVSGRSARA